MAFVMVRHRVEDYYKWKPYFDRDQKFQREAGCLNYQLFRQSSDARDLVLLMEFDDMGKAREFFQSDRIREVMTQAGVTDVEEIDYLEDIESKTFQGEQKKAA